MARATAPIFPECDVSTNTILMCENKANIQWAKKALSLAKDLLNLAFNPLFKKENSYATTHA
jgi:hypothetical protein